MCWYSFNISKMCYHTTLTRRIYIPAPHPPETLALQFRVQRLVLLWLCRSLPSLYVSCQSERLCHEDDPSCSFSSCALVDCALKKSLLMGSHTGLAMWKAKTLPAVLSTQLS